MSNRGRSRGQARSAWAPLRHPVYRSLWIGSCVSSVGTWMQSTAGAWLMTSLASSPIYVALMQTASSLPFFLLGLPAATLGDLVDRRRLLLVMQGFQLAVALVLAAWFWSGELGPLGLLGCTLLLGVGSAVTTPSWGAVMPDLVEREDLPAAIALSSAAVNLARAIGPALGGLIVAAAGAGAVFALNAASFLAVMQAVLRMKSFPRAVERPEALAAAMRSGLRYVVEREEIRSALIRTLVFTLFSSALWALLPLVAKSRLGLSGLGYGGLLAAIGAGALCAAALLPHMRVRFSPEGVLGLSTVLFALATVALASLDRLGQLVPALGAAGFAWMLGGSSLRVTVQWASPRWVRSRVLGMYLLVFQGGMAGGSALFGALAARFGTERVLLLAAFGAVLSYALGRRFRLSQVSADDLDAAAPRAS